MLLALDTATRMISIAIHNQQQVIAEQTWQTANHHTVELGPAIDKILSRADISVSDLKALAVTTGPGSYTGLRIGMSLAKGMALASSPVLPLVGIPTLDVIAFVQLPITKNLIAVIQAGRGRISAGRYTLSDDRWHADKEPFNTTWQELIETLRHETMIAGEINAQGRSLLEDNENVLLNPAAYNIRRAGFLAELAYEHIEAGLTHPPSQLSPVYLT